MNRKKVDDLKTLFTGTLDFPEDKYKREDFRSLINGKRQKKSLFKTFTNYLKMLIHY